MWRLKLFWGAPLKPNGEISEYEIRYDYENSHRRKGHSDLKIKKVSANENEVLIDQLNYYSDYLFEVRVCIKVNEYVQQSPLCGDTWAAIKMKTGIGGKSNVNTLVYDRNIY